MVALGVFLHAVGGFAAGSFYIPLKKVKNWAWESGWLVNGVFSWIIAPWVVGLLTVPGLVGILRGAPTNAIIWTYVFGVLWGVGGLTFGLSMRYLGMSLGYAVALGFCAAFGTLIPPIYAGTFGNLLQETGGRATLAGVAVCIVGIAICGLAGIRKEHEASEEEKKEAVAEFNLVKGILVALFAGVMSACMAFAFQAGAPLAKLAVAADVHPLWQNNAVLVVALAGGFTTNFIWCVFLNIKNKSSRDYVKADPARVHNYLFAALAGVTWYLQFMFYGMGSTKMGTYHFASWTLHMAFIIAFSNMWGLYFKEWKGASRGTKNIVWAGILTLILSTVVIGAGNYYAQAAAPGAKQAQDESISQEQPKGSEPR